MIKTELRGKREALIRLAALELSPAKRRKVLQDAARRIKRESQQNARAQKAPAGGGWQQRKHGNKKMMRRIPALMSITPTADDVKLHWKNPVHSDMAARHHYGKPERVTAAQLKKQRGQPKYDAPVSRRQAIKLRQLGYVIPGGNTWIIRGGKVQKKKSAPSVKWIMKNIKQGQAGLIIRILKEEAAKTEWEVPAVPRPWLDIRSKHNARILAQELKKVRKK
ncbi:phage virion morphogenesis protein [Escherichia coli]|uniref:phage virion morphogenesis protein n=1 Tax=Escherichia coli TaxID=562 RepID=UPI0005308128|nr:phage virion morphogenesis protein [Escherichia coli]EGB1671349.1 phage virion morphogenesis protein [Escherichia coli]EHM2956311.1 phage virion morphogenesis protein [Escherichia coli]EMB3559064.1 phage virion morphogenesis protein [Escherichia coli]HCS7293442.1 phage virion morphogenesis protein [Escherichia coli]